MEATGGGDRLVDTALEVHGVHAGGNRLQPFREDGLGQAPLAVVVPSPASSEVWLATSLTIWAPMFSNLSLSSISLATETPSLVTVGAPKDLSSTTLRPFGPKVTLTASAKMLTPLEHAPACVVSEFHVFRAHCLLLADVQSLAFEHAEDLAFAEDEQFIPLDLHRAAAVLAENDLVAHLDVWGADFAVVQGPCPDPRPAPRLGDGFSAAESGSTMPPAVVVSSSNRRTTTRSCKGRMFIADVLPVCLAAARQALRCTASRTPQNPRWA